MYKINCTLDSSRLFFSVKEDGKIVLDFSVVWFNENQESHIFRETLKLFKESQYQIADSNELEDLATWLDYSTDQTFLIFESRPKNKISEFDRYFATNVKTAITSLKKSIMFYFQPKIIRRNHHLLRNIFLCIVDSISSIADIYLSDNRIQNKLRMQRIANKENPYGDLPESPSIISEEDIVLQTVNVANMLGRLTPLQKQRVIKYFFHGYTYNEIAKQEDVNYSTIYESIKSAIKEMSKSSLD